ncbi:helix-turn-helix domain-containing protein [Chitinophaga rhizosphaerae]|uniref:helix-turn-helix domain-containing protein n=1 Tax=Chitinophaga rhizosphaerae TaxID=1864947 RepID=UPI000F8064D4|nr:helix-turn-helix domain-containing protein [Chitinophaga rhizosphaerae]
MASKKEHIEMVNLGEYARASDDPQEFSVSHLCSLGPVFFEHQEAPHRHDFYTIYWIKKGELTHTIDTVTHTVKKNTLFFLAPGQVHQLKSSEKIDGYMIAFHNCMMCPAGSSDMDPVKTGLFVNDAFSSVVPVTDPEVEKEIDWMIQRMEEEVTARRANYHSAFRNLLQYFLIIASRNAPKPVSLTPEYQSRHNSALFMTFKGLIEQRYKELKNVSDYAAQLHIKPVLLNEISKQLSGITAGEHIRNRVILEAQRYLFNTDLTAKEIAYALGFEDPHYFSRFFKKYTNQTPSEFKELAKA